MAKHVSPKIALLGGLIFIGLLGSFGFFVYQVLTSQPSKDAVIWDESILYLSPLAIEGQDIYKQQNCGQCHNQTSDSGLLVSGMTFAAKFPFQANQLQQLNLADYLTGANAGQSPSHEPVYIQLATQFISGSHTQAKLIANTMDAASYDLNTLVQASAQTAGMPKIQALNQYLKESAVASGCQFLSPTNPCKR